MSLRSLLIDPEKPIIHRDLSWLQFNERVLSEARDPTNPLLERLRYLGITSSNLDEFFMIRFASLQREISTRKRFKKPADRLLKIEETLLLNIKKLKQSQEKTFDDLCNELKEKRIFLRNSTEPDSEEFMRAKKLFKNRLVQYLGRPENLSRRNLKDLGNLSLALIFPNNQVVDVSHAIPGYLVRKLTNKKVEAFVTDKLLIWFAAKHFGFSGKPMLVRLTRDADVQVVLDIDDPESIPDTVIKSVNTRALRKPVRLQYRGLVNSNALGFAAKTYGLNENQLLPVAHPMLLHTFYSFIDQVRDKIKSDEKLIFRPMKPRVPDWVKDKDKIYFNLKKNDFLLHHPYDSFQGYVKFLQEATEDPAVESIQQTVYRVDAVSEARELLLEAARRKHVRVFIEPRARFDEINNIQLADELSRAGAEVVFPKFDLKMHAKMSLVKRREGGGIRNYVHLSTGNYNAKTARQYEDLAILSAHPGLGQDATDFFDQVAVGKIPTDLRHLVIAPKQLHKKVSLLIQQEILAAKAGMPAKIFAKVNALVDEQIVFQLYEASKAGVEIDLLVRGPCSLIPRVPGLSDNIKVYSVVDRFLEHSRLYYFRNTSTLYLSSADWMPRNFFSRLEIAFPVLDPRIFSYIEDTVIPTYLQDRVKSRYLTKDGIWRVSTRGEDGVRAQEVFAKMMRSR